MNLLSHDFRPSGPYGVLLTPFLEKGRIDEEGLEKELDFMLASDIAGIFPCATTGEFISLSPEDNLWVMEKAAAMAKGRKRLVAGVCAASVPGVVRYAKRAYELGYDAIVLCPPYYITMPQSEILEFYLQVAKETAYIPMVLYHIPMFTSELSLDVFQRLLSVPSIVGLKDSGQNMKRIAHEVDICRRERPDFSILTGTDDMLVPSLVGGCVGSMTAFSAILPEANCLIYRLMAEGKVSQAMEVNQSYLKLLRLADSLTFPAGYKRIFAERGIPMGNQQVVSILGQDAYRDLKKEIRLELLKVLALTELKG